MIQMYGPAVRRKTFDECKAASLFPLLARAAAGRSKIALDQAIASHRRRCVIAVVE